MGKIITTLLTISVSSFFYTSFILVINQSPFVGVIHLHPQNFTWSKVIKKIFLIQDLTFLGDL